MQRIPSNSRPLFIVILIAISLSGSSAPADDTAAAVLQPFVDRHELAGAVIIVGSADKTLHEESIGFADLASGTRMHSGSVFWIASQTKPMTAAALMILADEGKVRLDDPVEKYLPEFRGQMAIAEKDEKHVMLRTPVHRVSIRELLNHTSGLPFRSEVEQPTLDALPLATAVRSYAMTPLQTEPGSHYQYSNAGINTAARVIEVVAGVPYHEFLQQRLLDPLQMTETTFWPSDEQCSRIATSYRPNTDKTQLEAFLIPQLTYPLTNRERRYAMPAGGLFSTAGDTLKFCQMILGRGVFQGQRILSESAVLELTKRQTPEHIRESYGLGFAVNNDSFGHGGAHATNMEIRPAENLILIWMVQHAGYPGNGSKAQGAFREWAVRFRTQN